MVLGAAGMQAAATARTFGKGGGCAAAVKRGAVTGCKSGMLLWCACVVKVCFSPCALVKQRVHIITTLLVSRRAVAVGVG